MNSEVRRWIGLAAAIFSLCSNGSTFAFSVYSDDMRKKWQLDSVQLNCIVLVGTLASSFGLPSGWVYDRYGPLGALCIAAILSGVGWLLLALAYEGHIGEGWSSTATVVFISISYFLAMFATCFSNTGALLGALDIFTRSPGAVVLLCESFVGLGATLTTAYYNAFFYDFVAYNETKLLVGSNGTVTNTTITGYLDGGIGAFFYFCAISNFVIFLGSSFVMPDGKRGFEALAASQPCAIGFWVAITLFVVVFLFQSGIAATQVFDECIMNSTYEMFGYVTVALQLLFFLLVPPVVACVTSGRCQSRGNENDADQEEQQQQQHQQRYPITSIDVEVASSAASDVSRRSRLNGLGFASQISVFRAQQTLEANYLAAASAESDEDDGDDASKVSLLRQDEPGEGPDDEQQQQQQREINDPGALYGTVREGSAVATQDGGDDTSAEPTFVESLKEAKIWLCFFIVFALVGCTAVIIFNSTFIYQALAFSAYDTRTNNVLVMIVGLGSAVGRIFVGTLLPRFRHLPTFLLLAAPLALLVSVSLLLFPSDVTVPMLFVAVGFATFAYGVVWSSSAVISISCFGRKSLGKTYNFICSAPLFSAVIINILLYARSFDAEAKRLGTFPACREPSCVRPVLHWMLGLAGAALAACVVLHIMLVKKNNREKETTMSK